MIESLLPSGLADVIYLDYGLHVAPQEMTKEIQQEIDRLKTPSLIFLGYGLCGNGLVGLQSNIHTLVIPRTDDCIALLLGSYHHYREEFSKEPGTYYLTKGWLEAGSNPLQEYLGYVEKYGVEKADLIMELQYKNYTRLMFVIHQEADLIQYQDQVNEIAAFCSRWDMRLEVKKGSDRYIQELINVIQNYRCNGNTGLGGISSNDFVIVNPGIVISQGLFLRKI
jgi:hypothetical protein